MNVAECVGRRKGLEALVRGCTGNTCSNRKELRIFLSFIENWRCACSHSVDQQQLQWLHREKVEVYGRPYNDCHACAYAKHIQKGITDSLAFTRTGTRACR